MMSREVMKLALEALEVATTPLAKDRQEVLRAQAALREALAEQPAQQEPVAHCEGGPEFCSVCHKELNPSPAIYPEEAYEMGLEEIAYYTSPPAQRTWVGLTDEERKDIELGIEVFGTSVEDVLKEAEAKLREKNNGN